MYWFLKDPSTDVSVHEKNDNCAIWVIFKESPLNFMRTNADSDREKSFHTQMYAGHGLQLPGFCQMTLIEDVRLSAGGASSQMKKTHMSFKNQENPSC